MEGKISVDVTGLRKFLLENPSYFKDEETDVDTVESIKYWKKKSSKNIIHPGDFFMVDIEANEMWVVQYTEEKWKGHVDNKMKKISLVIEDCNSKFRRFNGYWKIPNQFLIQES